MQAISIATTTNKNQQQADLIINTEHKVKER